jgi:prephenate dehydrogenase
MATKEFKHVTIIGVGLLGGSIGLALKARRPRVVVAGVGRRQGSLDAALKLKAIDTAHLEAAEAVRKTDLVILATPIGRFSPYLQSLAPLLPASAVVTDVGSTKSSVVRIAERILGPRRFLGSHPMAGSEQAGVAHARADLLRGATCVLTPTARTPAALLGRLDRFWRSLGMRVARMSPASHDRAVAAVSHLPHAVAGLLMMLPRTDDLKVIGPGFRDMTRLCGGEPGMWRDVFMTNRGNLLAAIDRLDESLMELRDLIEVGDGERIESFFAKARLRRQTLM